MVQTTFTVAAAADLTTALQDISSGGTDAAAGTAYTIVATAGILANSETVDLLSGSSLTLQGGVPFIVNAFTVTGSVIADLNYTGTVTLDGGTFVNVATALNNGGTIVAGLFSGAILGTANDGGDTVINNGSFTGGSGFAIDLFTGTVQNGWNGSQAALISGGVTLASGLVQNGGIIETQSTTAPAVALESGTVDNGQLGDTTATISGGSNGVDITGTGTVNNDGTITNLGSDAVFLGSGLVTNGQIGDSNAWIDAGVGGNGVSINTGIGTVTNYGTVTGGSASGIYLALGGTITNGSALDTTALITGALTGVLFSEVGALINFGTVFATDSASLYVAGASLVAGGTIENLGTAATIIGDDWGASTYDGSAVVINGGTIEAASAQGLGLDLNAGGTVINGSSPGSEATISGGYDGVRVSAGAAGSGAVVVNDGTIEGRTGVDFQSGPTAASGTLTNDGLIETAALGGNAVTFGSGSERLVLQSAGAFFGEVVGGDTGSTTLELASGTDGTLTGTLDAGSVSDSAGNFSFTQFETIAVNSGATWILNPGTLNTVGNAGALSLSSGAVTVTGSLSNSGSLGIAGDTLIAATGTVLDTGIIAVSGDGTLQAEGPAVTVTGILGATGALTVSGLGSKLLAPGELNVGLGGAGSALIENQATAITGGASADASAGFDIGQTGIAPGNGTVPGSGAATVSNALLSNTGQFVVGDSGLGNLSITAGGTVTTTASATIANAAGSDGSSINVTGAGSALQIGGALDVGAAATGELAVTAGATVTAATIDAGIAASGAGIVTVSGTGADLVTTGSVSVGDAGSGELAILDGADATIAGDLNIANAGTGTGNVDIEDTTGTITFGGNIYVGFNGFGVLNIGVGVTYIQSSGGIIFGPDSSGSIGSFADPSPDLINTSANPIGLPAQGIDQLAAYLFNSGEYTIPNSHTLTFDTPLISGGGSFALGSNDHLTLNTGTVSGQTFSLGTVDTLTIGADALQTIDTPNSGLGPFTPVANPNFGTPSIGGFGGVVANFTAGNTIVVQTDGAATFSRSGSVVAVIENGTTLGSIAFDTVANATTAINTAGALVDQVVQHCFLPDTLIATPDGEVKVQHLRAGDVVRTAAGAERPVVWIGEGRVLAPRGRRSAATPVIVRRGALEPNVPHYDLHVTKGHALFIDGVLIPVEFLVNHRSILWDDQAREVSLYHVELDAHDVLLANGAPAESYRDDGNRWLFANANSGWGLPEKPPCAPVLTGGPVVDTVWQRLLERAGSRPGLPLTDDPDVHLLMDGVRVDGARSGDRCVFRLRAGAAAVRLVSRAASPAELGLARDPRVLGVAVRRVEVWQGPRVSVIDADDSRLSDGFHAYEPDGGIRWTDGDAELPVGAMSGEVELVVHLGGATRYGDTEGEPTTIQSVA